MWRANRALRASALVTMACACAGPTPESTKGPDTGPTTPVLVELFTSEGCSSCPPADDVLRMLLSEQPFPGVEVVALSEHVDYWNRLGWADPFSAPTFSARQGDYQAQVFPSRPVYTPQLVIDGTFECIGSDLAAIRDAIRRSAKSPKLEVRATASRRVPGERQSISIDITVSGGVPRHGLADVVVAVVEDDLTTEVVRGENHGRTLYHDAVVRSIQTVGEVTDDEGGSFSWTVLLQEGWRLERIRVVTFVQERGSRKVLGVASAPLPD